ncbi:MAG TPA: extracellular solute-binding protein [Tepidisphaeraceae bacterium]|jgi:multiple sugar transport system permease protein
MNLARIIRSVLGIAALAIVLWSFYDVGRRAVLQYKNDTARPITLTILHWGDPAECQIVTALCDRYMADHPQVRIVDIQATDERSKLKTMMAAGTPPDLFYLPPAVLPEVAQLKLAQPIDAYIKADEKKGEHPLADYYPILVQGCRYDVSTSRIGTGALYGLPKDWTPLLFYVNLDLFKAAGVPVPYNGWTWDQFEADMKKITALTGTPGYEGRKIYGGVFELWDDTIRQIIWTYGGDVFGKSFRDVTLDSPQALEAMQMIVRTRLIDKTIYNASGAVRDGAMMAGEQFINGNVGCDGPVGRWKVPTYKEGVKFHWDVVPIPYKTKADQVTLLAYTIWAMASGSEHKAQAYDLMKFLCGPDGAAMQSRLGLAVPPLKSVANSPDFLSPPGIQKHNSQLFLDSLNYARLGQTPVEAEWKDILEETTGNALQLGLETPLQAARQVRQLWLEVLDAPVRRHQWKLFPWKLVLCAVGGLLVVSAGLMLLMVRREKLGLLDQAQERAGVSFISPWLIGFLVLTLGPMILSLILAFTQWTGMNSLDLARGVGAANFKQLFTHDPAFYKALEVTSYYVLLAVPVGQIGALLVAMLMNARLRGIAIFRTIYFVPSVVSGAVLALIWLQVFDNDYGVFNKIVWPFARLFHTTPPNWFGSDIKTWGIPGYVIMSLWGVGGGMIIYLAGLKGIPASLYEAATVDGAGPMRKFWTITLPMLSPLIFYNVIMAIIGSFQVFTQAFMMTGAGPDNSTLFYVYYLYHQAFEFHNMGYASAMAWVLFAICLVLTLVLFRGSRGLVYYEGLKT